MQENANTSEALNALLVLGFSRPLAAQALREVDPTLPLEEMISQALKRLNRI
jgi:Holliday junction resolvasome RuvABC DNA-binding subunit